MDNLFKGAVMNPWWWKARTLFLSLMYMLYFHSSTAAGPVTLVPTDVDTFQDRDGSSNLRYFQNIVYEPTLQKLLIGAKNHLYAFDANNFPLNQKSVSLTVPDSSKRTCRNKVETPDLCDNFITHYALLNGEIFVCATGAYSPQIHFLRESDLSLLRTNNNIMTGICPSYPLANASIISSVIGNPQRSSDIYGMAPFYLRNFNSEYYMMRRYGDQLQTEPSIQSKYYFHGFPQSVAMFDIGDHIVFFFRETAVETNHDPELTYSRVGRVCKNDKGGAEQLTLEGVFTSFFKTRIVCSTGGPQPFYFNVLQDISRITSSVGDYFYGVFSSDVTGHEGSAVCMYSYADIQKAFMGKFLYQRTNNEYWIEESAPIGDKYKFKSAAECVNDTFSLTVFDHTFVEYHTLMATEVKPSQTTLPIYINNGITYRRLVVEDLIVETIDGSLPAKILYLLTDYGQIYKVLVWNDDYNILQTRELQILKPYSDEVVTVKDIYLHEYYLFLTSDESVKKVSTRNCGAYRSCTSCVLDPHCGWDSVYHMCEAYTQSTQGRLIQNVFQTDSLLTCSSACRSGSQPEFSEITQLGSSLILNCNSFCESEQLYWTKDGQTVVYDSTKYILADSMALIMLNGSEIDRGTYACKATSNGVQLAVHRVEMADCVTPECIWQEEFRKWCEEFEVYKKEYSDWVCLKDKCLESDQCIPQDISQQCVP